MHERDSASIVSVRVLLVHRQVQVFGLQNLNVFLGVCIQVAQVVCEVFDGLEVLGVDDAARRDVVLKKKKKKKKGSNKLCKNNYYDFIVPLGFL